MTILVDRSRVITYQRCPRRRYLEYEHDGTGLRQAKRSIPLTVGTWVHKGLEVLLKWAQTHSKIELISSVVDSAVAEAIEGYDKDVRDYGLLPQEAGEAVDNYTVQEQRALIEAQIRAYALARLPELTKNFTIMEVELDEVWKDFGPCMDFMFTADACLREEGSGAVYVQSFKTAATYDRRRYNADRHDMQGLSELAGILERRPEALGVRMEYLIKGARRKNNTGRYVQDSFLVRPWAMWGITQESSQFSWMYQWENELGQTKRLPKGFTRVNIWELMLIKEWVQYLWDGGANPPGYTGPGPFEAMTSIDEPRTTAFVCPDMYYRSEDDIKEWRESTIAQELEIAHKIELLKGSGSWQLPVLFPKHTHSCDWPSKCPMTDICWGPVEFAESPISSGLFIRREPHHQTERDVWVKGD